MHRLSSLIKVDVAQGLLIFHRIFNHFLSFQAVFQAELRTRGTAPAASIALSVPSELDAKKHDADD
jgi:hypothetical protein